MTTIFEGVKMVETTDIMAEVAEIRAQEAREEQERIAAAEKAAQAKENYNPAVYADPTRDHIEHFDYAASNGFLATFFEAFLVNFGPSPDYDTGTQRDLYHAVAFGTADEMDEARMEFATIAKHSAPPAASSEDIENNVRQVNNFARGTGQALESTYRSFDKIHEGRLAQISEESRSAFNNAAQDNSAPAEAPENNYAPEALAPAAQ